VFLDLFDHEGAPSPRTCIPTGRLPFTLTSNVLSKCAWVSGNDRTA